MAKKVFLSAGHGGTDSGAAAYGLKEKDINLNILLSCKDELERHGVKVICSRTKDENDPVGDEVKEANKSGAKIAVSFHTNAAKGDGSETYYYTSSKDGKKLAELCEKHTKAIGQNSRGIKSGNHLYFVNSTSMVAVLCECGFIDNDKDNNIIDTVSEQKKFGVAYAKAILEYFGIKYKAPAKTIYKVMVQPIPKEKQVGAFEKKANATKIVNDLKKLGIVAKIK
jgi:N-acetylmuramoyl-L-alanine amidase